MAQTMICDGCNQAEAVVMVTQIGTGEIQAFDPQCAITWAETFAAILRQQLGLPTASEEAEQQAEHAAENPDTADRQASAPPAVVGATMGEGQPVPAAPTTEG